MTALSESVSNCFKITVNLLLLLTACQTKTDSDSYAL
jgi:hypothetical protein